MSFDLFYLHVVLVIQECRRRKSVSEREPVYYKRQLLPSRRTSSLFVREFLFCSWFSLAYLSPSLFSFSFCPALSSMCTQATLYSMLFVFFLFNSSSSLTVISETRWARRSPISCEQCWSFVVAQPRHPDYSRSLTYHSHDRLTFLPWTTRNLSITKK